MRPIATRPARFHHMSVSRFMEPPMTDPRLRRRMIRVLAAFALVSTLGGCIVVPVGAPGYYRPHHYRYY